ncbi:MAG TPA: hypothetical protein VI756_29800, partial [Blastocatellia bacterium]
MSVNSPVLAVQAWQSYSNSRRGREAWRKVAGVLSQVLIVLAACSLVLAQDPASTQGTGSISGTATVDQNPAPAVIVILTHVPTNGPETIQEALQGGGRRNRMTTRTDSSGHYQFDGLVAGRYELSTLTAALVETGPSARNDAIDVGDGDAITGRDFHFTKAGAISGRVTTQDGRPLIGVEVRLSKPAPAPNGADAAANMKANLQSIFFGNSATTDDRGEFRVYGLSAGKYKISVGQRMAGPESPAGPSIPKETFYPAVTDAASAGLVELASGNEVEGVDIKVGTGPQGFEVSGRVVDDYGHGVADVAVSYAPEQTSGAYLSMAGAGSHYTDSKGGFKLEHVIPGGYSAAVSFPFLAESDIYGEATKFVVTGGNVSGVELKVHTGMTVSGVATVEGTDDPQAAANLSSVQLFGASDSDAHNTVSISRTTLGSDGSFTLKGLPPGKLRLQLGDFLFQGMYRITGIKHNGVLTDGIAIAPGESVTGIELVLGYANCTISGQVTLEGGKLPPGTTMFAHALGGGQGQSDSVLGIMNDQGDGSGGNAAQVDPSGHFKIEHLVPGDYQ